MIVSGHKVLVTGSSMGIGFALAEALGQRQNRVLIAARRSEHLAEAARRLPGVLTAQCDVSDEADLRRLVETVAERLGGLSLLVNNAGVQCNDDFAAAPPETILRHVDQEIGTNLTGLVKLTALCVTLLHKEPASAVVNISSLLAIAPKQSAPVYCATKAAVRSFTKALRYQLEDARPSIRVIDVLPPMVDTAMTSARRGHKLSPKLVADEILRGIERDRTEIHIGASKTLALANRIHPPLAERMVRRR